MPIYSERKSQSDLFLNSIQKYINIEETKDFKRSYIKKYVYIKGNILEITEEEFKMILEKVKGYYLSFVAKNTILDKEGIFYNKWCKDKLELLNKNCSISNTLKNGSICWANLGYNIGNELRKLRPVILWRSSSDKRIWTIIPLTSKHKKDCYYFHYDLYDEKLGTAKIENMMNISIKRIKEMYYLKNKIAKISKKDNDEILKIIKRYYAFELSNDNQNQLHKNSEKVLT